MASRRLEVVIAGNAGDAVRALGQTERAVGQFDRTSSRAGSRFSSAWRSSIGQVGRAVGGLVAGAGLARFFSGAVSEAEEARAVMRQTAAVIESTGGVAGVTADHLSDLSGRLSELAAVDDEVIQQGGNVLLTFRNIHAEGGIFDDALASALDMSAALGTDLQSNIQLVGKALNDPLRGLTKLTRAGVDFTDQQRDQIAMMMYFGDTAGAQRIILEELATEFGGAAEANATSSQKFQVAADNIKEGVGNVLLPAMDAAADALSWMSDWFNGLPDDSKAAISALGAVAAAAVVMWVAIGGWPALIVAAIGGVAVAIWQALGPERVKEIQKWWDQFLASLPERWKNIQKDIQPVTAALRGATDMVRKFVGSLDWEGLRQGFSDLGDSIQKVKDQLGITSTNGQIAMQVLGVAIYLVFGGVMIMIGAVVAAIGAFSKLGKLTLDALAWQVAVVKSFLSAAVTAAEWLVGWLQKLASVKVSVPGLDSLISALKTAWAFASNLWNELSNLVNRTLNVSVRIHTPIGSFGFARGTESAPPGLHWVGENGPELMAFRGGERVFSAAESSRLARASDGRTLRVGGASIVVNIHGRATVEDGQEVVDALRRWQRSNGPVPVRTI